MNICPISIHMALDKNLSQTMVICVFLRSPGRVRQIEGQRMMNLVHNIIYMAFQPYFAGYCPLESDTRTGFTNVSPVQIHRFFICFCLFCWHCDGKVPGRKYLCILQSFNLYLWLAVIKTEPMFATMDSVFRFSLIQVLFHQYNHIWFFVVGASEIKQVSTYFFVSHRLLWEKMGGYYGSWLGSYNHLAISCYDVV